VIMSARVTFENACQNVLCFELYTVLEIVYTGEISFKANSK